MNQSTQHRNLKNFPQLMKCPLITLTMILTQVGWKMFTGVGVSTIVLLCTHWLLQGIRKLAKFKTLKHWLHLPHKIIQILCLNTTVLETAFLLHRQMKYEIFKEFNKVSNKSKPFVLIYAVVNVLLFFSWWHFFYSNSTNKSFSISYILKISIYAWVIHKLREST